jgi:hypothetical protein
MATEGSNVKKELFGPGRAGMGKGGNGRVARLLPGTVFKDKNVPVANFLHGPELPLATFFGSCAGGCENLFLV